MSDDADRAWREYLRVIDEARSAALASRWDQSSLNNRQAQLDRDGRARLVMSLSDPGVPNWVDPAGLTQGLAQWRWYLSDRFPVPQVRRVALASLRDHLPAETPRVTSAERATQLARRERQVARRFGV